MPRKQVHDLNIRDFTYVVANMREGDEEELKALMPLNWPKERYGELLARAAMEGMSYTVHLDEQPIAAFGVGMGESYGTAHIWAFGTDKFKRAVPTIAHFVWNKIAHDLYNAGVMRLEARALSTHKFARDWLKRCGFHEDCALPYFGTNGESFHLYSMTVEDYNRRFKERLN